MVAFDMIRDVSKQNRFALLCAMGCTLVGLLACGYSYPMFLTGHLNAEESLLWWGGLISLSTAVAFIMKSYENNRQRNTMYAWALQEHPHVYAKNIPFEMLWWEMCGCCYLPYDEKIFGSLLELWEENGKVQKLVFSCIAPLSARKEAEKTGIIAMLTAVKCGVPSSDVFC